jgi:hypothetical protein
MKNNNKSKTKPDDDDLIRRLQKTKGSVSKLVKKKVISISSPSELDNLINSEDADYFRLLFTDKVAEYTLIK